MEKINKIIDPVIRKLLGLYVGKKFQKLIEYQINTGGKRIRPALAIICARLLGGKVRDVLYPAAGLEILHNYSLIIDDIIDNSLKRRGQATVWAKFGKAITQCIGIDWGAAIFQAANRSKFPVKISELFAKTLKMLVEGEVLDVLFEQSGREDEPFVIKNRYRNISENDYLQMVSKKTAVLFQSCCQAGAICAKAKERHAKLLKNYGLNLGIAFQIQDDLLDIFGKEQKFGKKIGKDIQEGKIGNIVICFALKEFSQKEKKEFLGLMARKTISEKEIKKAIRLIEKTGAKERAIKYKEKFIKKAKESLKYLPQNKWNKALEAAASLVVEREN